jgi:chitodextrinase
MIVSFQGSKVSAGQRRQLAFQNQCKAAFLNPILAESVAATLKAVEVRKEQGVKPERVWFPERQETGTFSVAEWMGY